ncbi:MAG: RNA polymerase subunit sigma-70 [Clostridiales bacterium]|nr:RNA polymerase subunit sigma-70 [Clostridiales bacterium]
MTDEQKTLIKNMRSQGCSYATIADKAGASRDAVKKYCQRHRATMTVAPISSVALRCKFCGNDIPVVHGRKQPVFCSTECRRAWWKAHPDSGKHKAYYTIVCAGCGRKFVSYGNAGRKYCSHDCYIRSRFKGGNGNG